MNIVEHLKWRYATKKFNSDKIIPQDKIAKIEEAFSLTATSFGLQPVKLVIIKNKELQSQLVEHSMNQQQVAQASHILVFCVENVVNKQYIENYFDLVKEIRSTPDEILKSFRDYLINDFENQTSDNIKTWATNQAYLTMGNLLTVCAVEGIDSCPMEGFLPEKYNQVLQLDKLGLSSVLVMPIGYRADDDMFSDFKKVRKPISESVINL